MKTQFGTYFIIPSVLAVISFGCAVYDRMDEEDDASYETLANVEAFSTSTKLNCEFIRKAKKCVIEIPAGKQIKIDGKLTPIKAEKWKIEIDGGAECIEGGETTCKPASCQEIFEIFGIEQ